MKVNQFWALVWLIVAMSYSPFQGENAFFWLLLNLSVFGYFLFLAFKAGEFK